VLTNAYFNSDWRHASILTIVLLAGSIIVLAISEYKTTKKLLASNTELKELSTIKDKLHEAEKSLANYKSEEYILGKNCHEIFKNNERVNKIVSEIYRLSENGISSIERINGLRQICGLLSALLESYQADRQGIVVSVFSMIYDAKSYTAFKQCEYCPPLRSNNGSSMEGELYPVEENTDFLNIISGLRTGVRYSHYPDITKEDNFRDTNFRLKCNKGLAYCYKSGEKFELDYRSLLTLPIYNLSVENLTEKDIVGFLSVDSDEIKQFNESDIMFLQIVAWQLTTICLKLR